MATGGQKLVGYRLVNIGPVTLENTDHSPFYTGIVVCGDTIIVIDYNVCNVRLHRINDGKLLDTHQLNSYPRDMCLIYDMVICVMLLNGLIEIMSIDYTDMTGAIKRTRTLDIQGALDLYYGVVRFEDKLVVSGLKQDTMYWCIVSLDDGHVESVHQICKGDIEESYVTTVDKMIYISCHAGSNSTDTGVYGYDILYPSQCRYMYKHEDLDWPTSIITSKDGLILVCNNGPRSSIHQLTEECQLVCIFTHDIPRGLRAIFWDKRHGHIIVTCDGSTSITRYRPEHLGSHTASEVLVSDERRHAVTEETAIHIGQGNVDQVHSSADTEMPPFVPVTEDSQDDKQVSCLPFNLQDTKPSGRQLGRLSLQIGPAFRLLGLELGLSWMDIQQIQNKYSHTVTQCLMILVTWHQQNGDGATFKTLEKTFQLVGINVDILRTVLTAGETSTDEDFASSLPHHMKDMKPSEGQLEELSKKIGQEIFLLGLELGLSLADILQIQKDHSQTSAECCHKILVKWQQQTEDRTSFKYLENAFQLVGIDVNILKSIGTGIPLEILRMDETSIRLFKDALQSGIERVYRIRVMVVGQFSVGKTALVKRLLGEEVNIKEKHSTEGIDVHVHCCDISLATKEWIRQKEDAEQSYRVQRLVKLLKEHVQKQEASGKQKGQSILVDLPANIEHVDMHHADIKISNQPVQSKTEVKTSDPLPSISHSPLPVVEVDKGHVEHLGQTKSSEGSPVIKAESRRSKEREDVSMEMLHLINKSSDKSKSMAEIAVLAIWDFAGQYIFYSTHQTFLTSRAVYLLVIDLEKPITEIIVDDQCFFDTQGIKECRVHNLTEIWLNSIHSCAPSPDAGTPPVILVGTHVDKIPEANRQEVIDKYFQQILCILSDKPILKHVDRCISIDNTQFDPQLKTVKERIFDLASGQPYWGEEVPANWLLLEESLMKLKDSGLKVILLSEVEELNQKGSVPIKTTNHLDLFLRFQHEIGNIIYFSVEGLREKIVLDPQWIINALKSLITAEKFVLHYRPAVWGKWLEFSEKGILTTELIDAIWTADNEADFYCNKEHILQLMEKLHIVARPRSSSEQYEVQYFLAPCMLKEATPKKLISFGPNTKQECTTVLCFVFTGKFLPAPVFHKLLAACVAEWQIAEQNSSSLVFCGCCVFQLDIHHRLTLYFKDYVIFARIRRMGAPDECQSSLLCSKTRTFIFENLNQIIGNLSLTLKFELQIQCPDSDADSLKGLIPLSSLENSPAVPCNSHDESHILESKGLLKFWFDVKQTNYLVEQEIPQISDLTLHEKFKLPLPPGKKYHVFFSYASPDIQWIRETVERLENDHGFVCCEYDRDNTPGTQLLAFAADSIKYSIKTVVVMTKEAFKSGFVKHEIQMALQQGFETGRKCVVPVLVQDCTIPDYLRILNYVDARDPTQRDIWWPKLLKELQTQAGDDSAPEVTGSDQRNQHLSEETLIQLEQ